MTVKYCEVIDAGDEARFIVLEVAEPRALIEMVCDEPIKPQRRYNLDEIERATP